MKNKFFFKKKLSNIYEKSSLSSKVSSQILYGEKFKILSKTKNWLKIKTSFDNYTGYIKKKDFVDKFSPTHKIFKLKSKIFTNFTNIDKITEFIITLIENEKKNLT